MAEPAASGSPLIRAASGNAGMSQTSAITACSPLHLMDLVDIHHRPVSVLERMIESEATSAAMTNEDDERCRARRSSRTSARRRRARGSPRSA
jgi:hypothetical protein